MNLHDSFFTPRGIVIIGASGDTGKLGYAVARNLVKGGYPGKVHFVNPKGGSLFDLPIYESVLEIPDPVDLAVVIIPAPATPQAMKEIGIRGIKSAILTSGGFREIGGSGVELEMKVAAICKDHGIRLIGPNCIGLVDTHLPLDTTFLPPPPPDKGNIAFISHSGAFCAAVIDWARRQGFGFSRLISLGNQADLTETDMLPLVAGDPNTKAITLYLESIPNGIRFFETAKKVAREKPVIVLKVGRTSSGKKAAASHTGALAGTEAAVDAALEKAGIIRASTSEELFDWSNALASFPLPAGNNVAVLTNAGGPGVIAADALSDYRLTLAKLDEQTMASLRGRLPSAASIHNPVDMLASASPEDYAFCLKSLLDDPGVDSIMVIIPPSPIYPTMEIPQSIIPLIKQSQKPVIPVVMGSLLIEDTVKLLNNNEIPCYSFPERAASALSKLASRKNYLLDNEESSVHFPDIGKIAVSSIIESIRKEPTNPILGSRLLEAINIPVAQSDLARTRDEAVALAEEIGFPLVAKLSSPDIIHKSDVGGVITGIDSIAKVKGAFDTIVDRAKKEKASAQIIGITLQKQITDGQEVILGFSRDSSFGPLMMFGSGGVEVEGLKDIAFGLAPLTTTDAKKLITKTWAGRKLDGFRNLPPADKAAVLDALIRLSWLAYTFPQLTECEINPLIVLDRGAVAVDIRVKLQEN